MTRSKYGATKTIIDGITFDSKAEAAYYRDLILLKRAGQVIDIEIQPVYELQQRYKRGPRTVAAIKYKADFRVTYKDGRQEVVDVKGMRTPVYNLKKKMFEFKYPELEIVEVRA